jgi:hypothetical protein
VSGCSWVASTWDRSPGARRPEALETRALWCAVSWLATSRSTWTRACRAETIRPVRSLRRWRQSRRPGLPRCRASVAPAPAGRPAPLYVIGTEVPVPGRTAQLRRSCATDPRMPRPRWRLHRQAFARLGLDGALTGSSGWWCSPERVRLEEVFPYDHARAEPSAPAAGRAGLV